MAHPVEPEFGRHGEYSTGRTAVEAFRQGAYTTPTNMYHGNGETGGSMSLWMKLQMHADSLRDAMGDKCCRCLHHMPSFVLIIAIIVVIGLVIAAVPIAFILISNSSGGEKAEAQSRPGGVVFHPIRHGFVWPGYNEDADMEHEDMHDSLRDFSASALFPPNVSLCMGFGFACTSKPSIIISTTQRCDGKADCEDGSDEMSCLECQTPFWCESARSAKANAGSTRAHERRCLRADQLCDGTAHCPDQIDETSFCRKSTEPCPAETKRCAGTPLCLPQESFCDGEPDCRQDDDEKDCKACNRGAKMCKPLGRCIAKSQLCDGVVNCPDGSDELECDCKACSGSMRALCGNGRCLERDRVCDGVVDCDGGMDEQNCPGSCSASKNATTDESETVMCADGRRYPMAEACSGHIRPCARSCPKCDAKLAFRCTDGLCIRKMQVCDGMQDCVDGEDEKDCDRMCEPSRQPFKCATGNKCVAKEAKCDGVRDCDDGSDENECTQCPASALHCVKDKRCFPGIARCDGVPDCSDGSDESNCTCDECTGGHTETYTCESTPHCFKRDTVCNPYSRCPNATHADKLFCASRALKKPFN